MILEFIRYILLGIGLFIVSTFWMIVSLIQPAHPRWAHYAANSIGILGKIILNIELEVENWDQLKNTRGHVIISNHQSNFDIFYVGYVIPKLCVGVGKKDILYFPFFGQMFWLTGNFFIERAKKSKAWSVMDKVAKKVAAGTSVWIMPEGTRSKDRGLLPFKKGAFVVALKAQVPVTCVVVSDIRSNFNIRKWKSGRMKIKVLPPIETKDQTMDDLLTLKDHCQELFSNELKDMSKKDDKNRSKR